MSASERNRFLVRTDEKAEFNQYWYSAATIALLVDEAREFGTAVACVSTPSVFFSLKDRTLMANSRVFDIDEQWASTPEFVRYDYKEPTALSPDLRGSFDFIVVDPPFITRDVWELYAQTVRFLMKPGARLLLSSVAENEAMLHELLGVSRVVFQPSIPHLVYQYSLFANYESPRLGARNPEIPED
eukprot:Amastigsp_a619_32.p1 type:complete len:186 gc:universal Amastigsp_a619_32:66-623(+)